MAEPFGKYTLLEPIAAGGMGEVFLARAGAHGVERTFAIKRILTRHAHSAEFAAMLMREARISIGLVHPNIAQIFEFGELEGHFYLAMEYVEGLSLSSLLARCAALNRKLPPADALSIGIQLCRALDYAHEKRDDDGNPLQIVHRDVSPHNILIDTSGMVKLIDFGIAKAADSITVTETGFVKGKIAYMSPEQSRGEPQDRRDDIFSVGVVLFECLANERMYGSEATSMKVLARLHDRDIPNVNERLPESVPEAARTALRGALVPHRADRIQSAAKLEAALARARNEIDPAYTGHALGKLVAELDEEGEARRARLKAARSAGSDTVVDVAAGDSPTISLSDTRSVVAEPGRKQRFVPLAAVVGLLAAAATGVVVSRFVREPAPAARARAESMSILVADFENQTGDEMFDDVLEGAITVALESAPFISAFKRRKARSVLAKIEPGNEKLDREAARLVAQREGVELVIAGSVSGTGPYELSVDAIDGMSGRTVAVVDAEADDRDVVLRAIDDLARELRASLGDTVPEAKALAAVETYTTSSLEAAQAYARGQELARAGYFEKAVPLLERAVELDPEFGRAYSGLAIAMVNLRKPEEAEKYFQQALARMDRMTERERLRTRSGYFVATHNFRQAVADLEILLERYPGESAAAGNLALAYFYARDFEAAVEMGRRHVERYPEHVQARSNLGLYAMYAGDFDQAMAHLKKSLAANPEYSTSMQGMALCHAARGELERADSWYDRMAELGPHQASVATLGRADLAMIRGRYAEAAQILTTGIETDLTSDSKAAAARKLALLAEAQVTLGQRTEAGAALAKAVKLTGWPAVQYAAARQYLALGRAEDALAIAGDLKSRLTADLQGLGLLIEGEHELLRSRHPRAVELVEDALRRDDSWQGHLLLGRIYLEAGAFAEAYAELDTCVKRRGEAVAIFMDDLATFHEFPPVLYDLGRALEEMGRSDAANSYRAFLELRVEGPLVEDARARLAALTKE